LPKTIKGLAIQLAIVLAINFIFWPIQTWRLPGPVASLVSLIIFLTATYNNVIPKTIYWVIIFTFGKKLFSRIRKDGPGKALAPIKGIGPEFAKARQALQARAWTLLLLGGGIGLIVANNFASYSRFSQARNKMDKYFVAIVISFAVSYILGESKKGWLFKFGRLASNDIARIRKQKSTYTDDHTFLLLSGFVAGLLLDAPLILMKMMYGGYILGLVSMVGAVALIVIKTRTQTSVTP
jgi:hypothetical protein